MSKHVHRWVLEGPAVDAPGVCRCGKRREFTGGCPPLMVKVPGMGNGRNQYRLSRTLAKLDAAGRRQYSFERDIGIEVQVDRPRYA